MSVPLAIVGYGKMGRLVEELAPDFGFAVRAKLSAAQMSSASASSFNGATVGIEFTNPAAALRNLPLLAALHINTVCGTTGWFEQLPQIRDAFAAAKTGLVFGPNFSIGIHLFRQMVSNAASLMAAHPEYEAWGWEIHHSAKKDAPSGTLKKLAEEIGTAGYRGKLDLSSSRAGAQPGTHEIGFDSGGDTITLRHTARSREGFARGALQAARWIARKEGVHEFSEIVDELSKQANS